MIHFPCVLLEISQVAYLSLCVNVQLLIFVEAVWKISKALFAKNGI